MDVGDRRQFYEAKGVLREKGVQYSLATSLKKGGYKVIQGKVRAFCFLYVLNVSKKF
jgi:hypothetical protein